MMEQLLKIAAQPGEIRRPTRLLEAAGAIKDALGAINDVGCQHKWMSILESEFGAMPSRDAGNVHRWIPLLRWVFEEITTWRDAEDRNRARLAAVVLVVAVCDIEGGIWESLPASVTCSPALITLMEDQLSRISIVVNVAPMGGRWEKEHLDALQAADAIHDWVELDHLWPGIGAALWPSLLVTYFVRSLAWFDFHALVRSVDRINGFLTANTVMEALPSEQRLRLGQKTRNKVGRFASIYSLMSNGRRNAPLSAMEQDAARAILVSTANDLPEWQKWMAVFNTYPLRYPTLQRALGSALASLGEDPIRAYVESIHLYTSCDGSRGIVADCLKTFAEEADEAVRRTLWSMAFERWVRWRFNAGDQEHHLFQVACSELDFAVVGYCAECLDELQRKTVIDEYLRQLGQTELTWFSSESAYLTAFYRTLSELQPYCHARRVGLSKENWLNEKVYMPVRHESHRYYELRSTVPGFRR